MGCENKCYVTTTTTASVSVEPTNQTSSPANGTGANQTPERANDTAANGQKLTPAPASDTGANGQRRRLTATTTPPKKLCKDLAKSCEGIKEQDGCPKRTGCKWDSTANPQAKCIAECTCSSTTVMSVTAALMAVISLL